MQKWEQSSAHGKCIFHPSRELSYQPLHCRYATLQNLDAWTRGPLQYQVRASCSQQQACPAPSLGVPSSSGRPPACSGNGACGGEGACACNAGWGDVGCDAAAPPLVPDAPEAHTLASNGWMYWEVVLEADAAALSVQLTRSAGDPVLFLKRADQGFQARQTIQFCMTDVPL